MVIRKITFDAARTKSVLFATSEESIDRVTYVGRVTEFLWTKKFIHNNSKPISPLSSLPCKET